MQVVTKHSSPPKGHSLPSPPSSANSERPEIAIEGQQVHSKLEHTASLGRVSSKSGDIPTVAQGKTAIQFGSANLLSSLSHRTARNAATDDGHGPSDSCDARSVSLGRLSKSGYRKRLSRIFKGDSKVKETIPASTALSAPITLFGTEGRIQSAALDHSTVPVSLKLHSPADPVETSSTMLAAPDTQVRLSPTAEGPIRMDIFPGNAAKPIYKTDLPKPHARVDKTPQLVYCCSLLSKARGSHSSTSASDASQNSPLDDEEKTWVQLIDPVLQGRYQWLVEQLVKAFAENPLKASDVVTEIVIVGPVLDRDTYRSLLSCFISRFEQTTALDVTLLEGLVQLVECASSGYLVDDDLVRIATALSRELSNTHIGFSNHPLCLTLSLARVLDVMVTGEVKDLNRERDHQPMLQLLDIVKDSGNVVQKYEASYAYQALQYAPDNETPLQVLWRYAKVAAAGAGAVSSVFKLDPEGLLKAIESLHWIGAGVVGAVTTGVEAVETLRFGADGVVCASEREFDFMTKRSWYLALQGTALFIRQGRLSDFNLVVSQAPCRHNPNFQWGICRQLGEIAVDPLWDAPVRRQAVEFLGELFRSSTDWKPRDDVKRWILTILVQIKDLSDVSIKNRAGALLRDLKKGDIAEFPGSYPLSRRLPLPSTSPLLAKVQEIPKLEYDLHVLRSMRIAEYKQAVYIDPMAKLSLQDTDDNLFPLMNKVRDFIAGDSQVMLILGDSGAGKSTFNRHLEHELWQEYKSGGRIPLFVNLPSLERPEKNLVAEQLRTHNFLEEQIRELKLHRQFTLICDGYDESQLTSNLHTTNLFSRSGQWDVKLLITCRTQYLGPDYRSRFEPKAADQYARIANGHFQQAVIAPFTRAQIEDYVEHYVPLEPRTWVKKDFMDKLEAIPNLMDLARNPFLLTLSLESLPTVVQGKADLTRLKITRAELYDTFVKHWISVNKRRLQDQKLRESSQIALDILCDDGFERNGILYQMDLAASIFQEQDGRPVVDYSPLRDRKTWKAQFFGLDPERALLRDSSLLSRAGNQYRFVHRSVLEYFFSRTISGPTKEHDEFDPPVHSETSGTSPTLNAHPLSQRNLVAEPSIIQFLAERVQLDSGFKEELLAIIELSKTDEKAARAAANAITILVKAGVRFNGSDLQGIRVPGADMSGGEFDSALLQGADLTGVNLAKSWIRQVDFTMAQMEGIRFGEMPYLKESEQVHSCAYSPDGTSLAVGLKDGCINIYDRSLWRITRTFRGHRKCVNSIAYSPTGHQLLSGSEDKTVRLWDCECGSCIFVLEGHTNEVCTVAFSPSGNQIASAGKDKTVRLWDVQTGASLFNLTGHTGWILSISYSPDGRTVVSVGDDWMIRFCDTHTGQPGDVWESQSGGMETVAYSPDGREIAVGDGVGKVLLYNATTGKPTKNWRAHSEAVAGVCYSLNGQWIATCSWDNTVKVWSAVTGSILSVFTGHSYSVSQLAFSPSGLQLASCSTDRTIRLWDVSSLETGMDLESGPEPLETVLFSPDGRVLFCGTSSGLVRQYDAVSGESGLAIVCGDNPVKCLAISPDGLRMASVGTDYRVVTVWDSRTGQADFGLCGHTRKVNAVAFSADERWIATGSDDETVRLWDARSGILDRVLEGHTHFIAGLVFSPNSHRILSGSLDKTIRAWDLDSRGCRVVVDGGLTECWTISASPDGLKGASKSFMSRYVEICDMESGHRQQTLEQDGFVQCLAFSSCGRWLSVGLTRSVWLWNFVSDKTAGGEGRGEWKCLVRIRDIFGPVNNIAWKPGTLDFGIGCANGSKQVWKLLETSKSPSDTWSAQLVWSAGNPVLAASDAVFAHAIGLSLVNQQLLAQRGKGAVVRTAWYTA
ncbi:WD40 repeat-like protein [Linnemannia elongata AG-77]|uniref:WD40 repeat-like protein n=1 Tax=Linnemannia elongata AG-77 TaxID=1314771 RepID=A0A197JDV7_9FUNG|nr:WD40 repeat-like protein [Linnemannia elongata AG-77]